MKILECFDLQMFGDGAPAGDGGATSGEGAMAVDAGQRLRELGVPENKIRKRASKSEVTVVKEEPKVEAAPTQEEAPTEQEETPAKRLTWDEIKNDPEYNKEIQKTIQARLKSSKQAEEALAKLTPAMELVARKYKMDPKNIDYEALANAINNDDAYYEERAMELGTSVETAKRVDQMEREEARRKEMEQRTLEQQMMQNHFVKLETQATSLKATFPNFNLKAELQNPAFARMLSPTNVAAGITVEDAYYAVHRKEIQAASMQVAAQKTAERISNAIQANSRRPDESGASSQAPSVSTFDYRSASKAQRDALKAEIRSASARGEKLYPNQVKIK